MDVTFFEFRNFLSPPLQGEGERNENSVFENERIEKKFNDYTNSETITFNLDILDKENGGPP